MKRQAIPQHSPYGKSMLAVYEPMLLKQKDLAPASIYNYLCNVRNFIARYQWPIDTKFHIFTLQMITTPVITLFPSDKTRGTLSEHILDYIVKGYAPKAKLTDIKPHDAASLRLSYG